MKRYCSCDLKIEEFRGYEHILNCDRVRLDAVLRP